MIESPGKSDEWYTPPEIFNALGVMFDLDPCAAPDNKHVPASLFFTKDLDGLNRAWRGFVWMNPPFGKRNGQVPWIEKFIEHGNGIGVAFARTSSGWFQDLMPQMDAICFPRGKTRYVDANGNRGGSPCQGTVLYAKGHVGAEVLLRANLGLTFKMGK